MPAADGRAPVLIASWLEPGHAERIAAAEPDRIELIYEPGLLPTPRYEADHHGPPRPLTDQQRRRWAEHLGRAEVAFEFDWERPEELLSRAPRCAGCRPPAPGSVLGSTASRPSASTSLHTPGGAAPGP